MDTNGKDHMCDVCGEGKATHEVVHVDMDAVTHYVCGECAIEPPEGYSVRPRED